MKQQQKQITNYENYCSCAEAARQLHLDSSVISKVCRLKKYKQHGGYVFKFVNN